MKGAVRSSTITTTVLDTEEAFTALRQEWDELLQASVNGCFFLTWEWLHTWWRHLAEDRKLHIITAHCDGKLVAIAPLALRPSRYLRLLPFPVLEFLGSGNVGSDYLNIVVRKGYEDAALRAIAASLTEHNQVLELSQVERTNPQMITAALQLRQLGWRMHRTTTSFCPYINLAGQTWDSYLARLGSAHRANFRRRYKKLQAGFDVKFELVDNESQRGEALKILIELHLKRWGTRGGSDALHREELIAFHKELSQSALQQQQLRLYVLWLDKVPVAALYGFVYNDIFYFYQSGFDMAYSDHSVGLVMMGLVIKDAIENGIREFDFLHGEESYKYLWADAERELVRFYFFPPHTRGSLYGQLLRIRQKLKRQLWHWMPRRKLGMNAS
jgi:CelD/BcsL family acetyltransferase involved in cellulose biosynthesis